MNDKELRKMGRGDLIDIIYEYQCRLEDLEVKNSELTRQLNDRTIQIKNAGSIAEAALSINKVFEAAQAAADMYLEELQRLHSKEEHDTTQEDILN